MNDFINPKSMLTPGVAGSLMMFLVNGITFQFPEIPIRYLALFLSFLIGTIVLGYEADRKLPVIHKAIYWFLNSLVIFVVGFGAANLAVDATGGGLKVVASHGRLFPFVSAAFAQDPSPQRSISSDSDERQVSPSSQSQEKLREELAREREELAREREENRRLKMEIESKQREQPTSKPPENVKQFFKRW